MSAAQHPQTSNSPGSKPCSPEPTTPDPRLPNQEMDQTGNESPRVDDILQENPMASPDGASLPDVNSYSVVLSDDLSQSFQPANPFPDSSATPHARSSLIPFTLGASALHLQEALPPIFADSIVLNLRAVNNEPSEASVLHVINGMSEYQLRTSLLSLLESLGISSGALRSRVPTEPCPPTHDRTQTPFVRSSVASSRLSIDTPNLKPRELSRSPRAALVASPEMEHPAEVAADELPSENMRERIANMKEFIRDFSNVCVDNGGELEVADCLVSQYALGDIAGSGQQGTVYVAYDFSQNPPARVVIKAIPNEQPLKVRKLPRNASSTFVITSTQRLAKQSSQLQLEQGDSCPELLLDSQGSPSPCELRSSMAWQDFTETPVSSRVPTVPMCEKEIEIMCQLGFEHENLVNLVEVIDDDKNKVVYLVMPHSGTALFEHAPDGSCPVVPLHQMVSITRQIACGLCALHRNGVLHRDLKPANILRDALDNIRICDFGVSVVIADLAKHRHHDWYGTLPYMAPEVLSSSGAANYTPAVDMWALGVILYSMAVGRMPFFASGSTTHVNRMCLIRMIVQDEPDIPDTVDSTLAAVIRNLLTKDPEARMSASQLCCHVMFSTSSPCVSSCFDTDWF